MTFLELQGDIKRTRKLLRKRRQQNSDLADKTESDKALELLYKKALIAANKVVNHYIDLGELDEKEKISVTFGNTPDTSKSSEKSYKLKTKKSKLITKHSKNNLLTSIENLLTAEGKVTTILWLKKLNLPEITAKLGAVYPNDLESALTPLKNCTNPAKKITLAFSCVWVLLRFQSQKRLHILSNIQSKHYLRNCSVP